METVWDLTVGGKVGGLAGLGVHRCGQALELAAAVQLAEVPHCQAVVAGAADKEVVVPRGELHTKAQLSRASRHELHLLRHWIQAISVKKRDLHNIQFDSNRSKNPGRRPHLVVCILWSLLQQHEQHTQPQ